MKIEKNAFILIFTFIVINYGIKCPTEDHIDSYQYFIVLPKCVL